MKHSRSQPLELKMLPNYDMWSKLLLTKIKIHIVFEKFNYHNIKENIVNENAFSCIHSLKMLTMGLVKGFNGL